MSELTERVLVIVVTIIVSVTLFLIDQVGNGKRKTQQKQQQVFVGNPADRWRGQPHTTPCMGREEPIDHALIANITICLNDTNARIDRKEETR